MGRVEIVNENKEVFEKSVPASFKLGIGGYVKKS